MTLKPQAARPFLLLCAVAGLPKWRRLIVRLLLKVCGITVAVSSQRESSQAMRKVMQMERATKSLKRIWKAVVVAELVVLAGVLIFVFTYYFSYSVFVSNFYQQANAATPVQRR